MVKMQHQKKYGSGSEPNLAFNIQVNQFHKQVRWLSNQPILIPFGYYMQSQIDFLCNRNNHILHQWFDDVN